MRAFGGWLVHLRLAHCYLLCNPYPHFTGATLLNTIARIEPAMLADWIATSQLLNGTGDERTPGPLTPEEVAAWYQLPDTELRDVIPCVHIDLVRSPTTPYHVNNVAPPSATDSRAFRP